jgi:hypothetical protein
MAERKKLFDVGKVIYPDTHTVRARITQISDKTLERAKGRGLPCMRK